MKNKFIVFLLLIAIITVLLLGIVMIISLQGSIESIDPDMMKVFDFFGIENDLCFSSAFDANTGYNANQVFAVNPYQTGNSERDMAVIIGASVSYILSEVKYFTLFIVVLTVLALNACSIIVYFILDKAATPVVKQGETQKNEELGMSNEGSGMIKEVKSCLPLYW
jgi:flagellar basal body-associated protein FliL